jgi:hypothetical protein
MMQSAQYRMAKNLSGPLNCAQYRRSLLQKQMRAYYIVVFHIRQQYVTKMPFGGLQGPCKAPMMHSPARIPKTLDFERPPL